AVGRADPAAQHAGYRPGVLAARRARPRGGGPERDQHLVRPAGVVLHVEVAPVARPERVLRDRLPVDDLFGAGAAQHGARRNRTAQQVTQHRVSPSAPWRYAQYYRSDAV